MTSTLKTALLAAVGAIALAGAAPAFAASPATDAFVANVHPNVDFLDNSSRLALKTAGSAKVRAFARVEATDQTLAGNQLVAWTQTQTPGGIVAATGAPVLVAPVDEAVAVAATAPTDVVNGVGDVLTGRSVAIDAPDVAAPLTVTRTPAPGTLLPSQQTDMDRLSGMTRASASTRSTSPRRRTRCGSSRRSTPITRSMATTRRCAPWPPASCRSCRSVWSSCAGCKVWRRSLDDKAPAAMPGLFRVRLPGSPMAPRDDSPRPEGRIHD